MTIQCPIQIKLYERLQSHDTDFRGKNRSANENLSLSPPLSLFLTWNKKYIRTLHTHIYSLYAVIKRKRFTTENAMRIIVITVKSWHLLAPLNPSEPTVSIHIFHWILFVWCLSWLRTWPSSYGRKNMNTIHINPHSPHALNFYSSSKGPVNKPCASCANNAFSRVNGTSFRIKYRMIQCRYNEVKPTPSPYSGLECHMFTLYSVHSIVFH